MDPDRIVPEKKRKKKKKGKEQKFEQDEFRMNHDTTPIDFSDNEGYEKPKKTAKQEMEFMKALKTKADLLKDPNQGVATLMSTRDKFALKH
jgi:hypothetical protein